MWTLNSLYMLHEDLGSDFCVTREDTTDTSPAPSTFQETDGDNTSSVGCREDCANFDGTRRRMRSKRLSLHTDISHN